MAVKNKYEYAVTAQYRGSHVHLSMLSDRFRKHGYGYQESFRKTSNDRYVLKLWFFEQCEYRKFENFVKLVNMGKTVNPVVASTIKVRLNYHTAKVKNKELTKV